MIEWSRADVLSAQEYFYVDFFFTHYNFLKRNRVETDVFNSAIASIFSQQNENNN